MQNDITLKEGTRAVVVKTAHAFTFFFFFVFLPFLGPLLWHMKVPRLGVLIRAVATGLRQSHSNARSEPCLQPTLQLTATLDP